MSIIIVGNISSLASVQGLSKQLTSMSDVVSMAASNVEGMLPSSGLEFHFDHVLDVLNNANDLVKNLDADIEQEFIVNFRNKLKNETVMHSVSVTNEQFNSVNSIFTESVLNLKIPMLEGRRPTDILVSIDNSYFEVSLKNQPTDIVIFEGKKIQVRDKYAIKPAQPGKASILNFTALPDTVTVIVTRINKDVEETRLKHLRDVVESSEILFLDEVGNVCVKL